MMMLAAVPSVMEEIQQRAGEEQEVGQRSEYMRRVFHQTHGYGVYMPSFGSVWGFSVGVMDEAQRLDALTPDEIDRRLAARLNVADLRYYDGIAHQGMMAMPKFVRQALERETRVITNDNPLYAE